MGFVNHATSFQYSHWSGQLIAKFLHHFTSVYTYASMYPNKDLINRNTHLVRGNPEIKIQVLWMQVYGVSSTLQLLYF